jgi:hypothetical protein
MSRMVSFILIATIAFFGCITRVCFSRTPPLPDITRLVWQQPYGLRGQVIPATVRLTDGVGMPLAGWQVRFSHRSDNFGTSPVGYAVTDGNGFARINYRIPTDPNSDNVYLIARFEPADSLPPGTVSFLSSARADIRVQIGRQYP